MPKRGNLELRCRLKPPKLNKISKLPDLLKRKPLMLQPKRLDWQLNKLHVRRKKSEPGLK